MHEECTTNLTRNILNNLFGEYHLSVYRNVQVMRKAISSPLLKMFVDVIGKHRMPCCRVIFSNLFQTSKFTALKQLISYVQISLAALMSIETLSWDQACNVCKLNAT